MIYSESSVFYEPNKDTYIGSPIASGGGRINRYDKQTQPDEFETMSASVAELRAKRLTKPDRKTKQEMCGILGEIAFRRYHPSNAQKAYVIHKT